MSYCRLDKPLSDKLDVLRIVAMAKSLYFLAALLCLISHPVLADNRVALVIGNFDYSAVPKIPNAKNDGAAVANLLRAEKFEVEERQNLANSELRKTIRAFAARTRDADIAIVYFAGHGIEVGGNNYLIPTDAMLRSDLDVEDEAVSLDRVLQVLEPAKRLRLVILDACRDNPFLSAMKRTVASRSVSRGLAQVEPARPNTLIAFAAKAGSVAEDGVGSHSPFTEALLKHITEPGLDIRLALGRVRDDVLDKTRNSQEPFVYGSLGGSVVTLSISVTVKVEKDDGDEARKDFAVAQTIGTVDGWDAFLARYRTGYVADLAKKERERLAARGNDPAAVPPADARPASAKDDKAPAFSQAERAMIADIAEKNKFPIPDYSFQPLPADVSDKFGMFVGVWSSDVGFHGGLGPQAMLIVTNIDIAGKFSAHYVIGPPTPQARVQLPARSLPVSGTISGSRLQFTTGRTSDEAVLSVNGDLDLRSINSRSGHTVAIRLQKRWRMAERAPVVQDPPLSEARPARQRKVAARPVSVSRSITGAEVAPAAEGVTQFPGGGGRRARGGVVNSPRFPMCTRLASQRGYTTAGPERANFVRNCVWSG